MQRPAVWPGAVFQLQKGISFLLLDKISFCLPSEKKTNFISRQQREQWYDTECCILRRILQNILLGTIINMQIWPALPILLGNNVDRNIKKHDKCLNFFISNSHIVKAFFGHKLRLSWDWDSHFPKDLFLLLCFIQTVVLWGLTY